MSATTRLRGGLHDKKTKPAPLGAGRRSCRIGLACRTDPMGRRSPSLHPGARGLVGRSGLFPLHDVRHHPSQSPGELFDPDAKHRETGCLDPLARAGKRKCANHSGAESTASKAGGARRDRTDDLMLAKHALSQLSYGPIGLAANGYVGLKRRRSRP
jgi:hypothetical protein